jgi:hypothetical protein
LSRLTWATAVAPGLSIGTSVSGSGSGPALGRCSRPGAGRVSRARGFWRPMRRRPVPGASGPRRSLMVTLR